MSNPINELNDYQAATNYVADIVKHSFLRLKQTDDTIQKNLHNREFATFTTLARDAYVFRDQIIIKIMNLFDTRRSTRSLFQLQKHIKKHFPVLIDHFDPKFKAIQEKYGSLLGRLKKNRQEVVAHLGKVDIKEVRIEAQAIFDLPIIELVNDIEALVNSLHLERVLLAQRDRLK